MCAVRAYVSVDRRPGVRNGRRVMGHPLRINEHPHGALCSVCGHTDDIHNEYGYCCVGRIVISGGWNGAPICRCKGLRTVGQWLEELLDGLAG